MKLSRFLQFDSWAASFVGDGLPEGPGGFPYVGLDVVNQWQDNPMRTFTRFYREYGNTFTLRFMGQKAVFLIGPEANQKLLVEEEEKFLMGPGIMGEALKPLLGKGLLTTDDEEHDRARRMMEPAFREDRLKEYLKTMIGKSEEYISELRPGDHIEVYEWSRDLALAIASEVLLGMDEEAEVYRRLGQLFRKGLSTYNVPLHFQALQGPFTPRASRRNARKKIRSVLSAEISERRKNGADGENILSILIRAEEDGEGFTNDEISDQLFTLLFAGHDTTISTVSWMMMLLGRNKRVYQKLRAHLSENIEGTPSVETIMNGLPYLDQVLDETLRLYPAAWVGARRTRESFKIYGCEIPADTNVAYSSMVTHRMSELFEHPARFDPSRFTPEKKRNLPSGAYVPFGRGPRTCIGMNFGKLEIKAIVSILLTRHGIELVPGQDFTPQWMPTLTPGNGVKVRIKETDITSQSEPSNEFNSSVNDSSDRNCPVSH